MTNTNQITLETYNKSVDEYIKTTPPKVDGHIKVWLDKCITMLQPDARIVEIGVGHGKDSDYLEENGFTIERTDASTAFVEYQIQNGHDAKLINVLTDDLVGPYDMVLADAVWLHFNPAEAELATKKVYESLAPEGIFALTLKQGDGEEITDRKLNSTRYFRYWQEEDARKLLETAGFEVIDIVQATDYRTDRPGWLLIIAKKVS